MDCLTHRALDRPTQLVDPRLQRASVAVEMPRQIRERTRYALVGVQLRASLIKALLLRRGPSAIARFVITIGVDAINRVLAGWARPHVGVEGGERFQPADADTHSTPAVPRKVLARDARAAVDQTSPRAEFHRGRQAMRGFRAQHVSLDTPTRVGASEIVDLNGLLGAARAADQRTRMLAVRFVSNNRQSTVRRTNGASWHGHILPYFAHVME